MSLIPLTEGAMQVARGMQDRFGGQGGPPQGGPGDRDFGPRGFDGHMGGHGIDTASFWIVSSVALALLITLVVLVALVLRELRRQGAVVAPRPAPAAAPAAVQAPAESTPQSTTAVQPPQPPAPGS